MLLSRPMIVIEYITLLIELLFRFVFLGLNKDALLLEIAVLRKENQILRRKTRRLHLRNIDRLFFVALYRQSKDLLGKLSIVKPETVIRWHSNLAKKKWTYSNHQDGAYKKFQEN